MKYTFLKTDKVGLREQYTFTGSTLEIFIPERFLEPDSDMSRILGDKLETIGLFWFKVNGSDIYELQLPVKIKIEFSDRSSYTGRLREDIPNNKYAVFILHNGDAFIYDNNHRKNIDDVKWFINKCIEGAKLPNTVSYNDTYSVFIKLLTSTETFGKLGVSSAALEFLLEELCRDRKNLSQPFRKAYNGKNDHSYRMVRITKLTSLSSTFQSITGEDINSQLANSILRCREHREEIETPIEKIIKY